MRGAWKIIQETHPSIYANGCAAHVLNLLVGDICDIEDHNKALDEAVAMAKFIK
jgi:hypothetical protein